VSVRTEDVARGMPTALRENSGDNDVRGLWIKCPDDVEKKIKENSTHKCASSMKTRACRCLSKRHSHSSVDSNHTPHTIQLFSLNIFTQCIKS